MVNNLNKNELKVYNYIKKNNEDYLNIREIQKHNELTYPTIRNIIRVLEVSGLIEIIKRGNNKFVKVKNE